MKKILKIKKYFLIFSIIIALFMPTLNDIFIVKKESNKDSINNIINVKSAGHWYLTGEAIFIDDSDPNYNWSKTAADNDWCSGSGSWNDPYVIENVTIDGQDAGSCLTILHSKTAFFVIRNCTFFNSFTDTGNANLLLDDVNNGLLINNTCYEGRSGIYLDNNSDNNTIVENILRDNILTLELETIIFPICTNIKNFYISRRNLPHNMKITTIMNPPFGVKKKKADRIFLEKAFAFSNIVYSIHLSSKIVQDFIRNYIKKYTKVFNPHHGCFFCCLCQKFIDKQRWMHFKRVHRYAED